MPVGADQASLCGTLTALRKTSSLASLAFTQLFYSHFVRLTTQHPPEHVIQPRRVRCAPALLPNRDEIALLQNDNELASVSPIAVRVPRHPTNRSFERCHNTKSICLVTP